MVDYVALYYDVIYPEVHYYQEPHAFIIKIFTKLDSNPVVLLHYKMWVESQYSLPRSPDDTRPENPPRADIEQILLQKRKMSRGQITKGQKSVWMKTLAALQQFRPVDEVQDVDENLTFMNETPVVSMNPSNPNHLRGILWISRSPVLDDAKCIKFTLAQVEKNLE